jgi:hypothetical protein
VFKFFSVNTCSAIRIKRIAASLLFLIASCPVLADTKAEIAKCVASETALKRLACFDDLAISMGMKIPSGYSPSDKKVAAQAKATLAQTDDKQPGRLKLIQELIDKGAFKKIERVGSVARIWVTPTFYTLDYDVKTKFSGLVYDYYSNETKGATNLVLLYDAKNGKQVGSFSKRGLDLD